MEKQLKYGYKTFTGIEMSPAQVDEYNLYTDQINSTNNTDFVEIMRNHRHSFLCLIAYEVI